MRSEDYRSIVPSPPSLSSLARSLLVIRFSSLPVAGHGRHFPFLQYLPQIKLLERLPLGLWSLARLTGLAFCGEPARRTRG